MARIIYRANKKIKIKHRSWTSRIAGAIFLIALSATSGLLGYYNYLFYQFVQFQLKSPLDSPFPLEKINATRVAIVVEGNPEDNNYMGAEMRQATYHFPLGFGDSVEFQKGYSPDSILSDPYDWNPDNSNAVNWTELSDVKVAYVSGIADSPIHTGEYLQAEALRWAVYNRENNSEGISAATQQISRILDGYWILTRATGIPGVLVRGAFPNGTFGITPDPNDPFSYYLGNYCPSTTVHTIWGNVVNPAYNFSNWVVIGDISRDQYIGTMMGLASVIKYVDNQTLLMRAGALAEEMVNVLMNNNWVTSGLYNGSLSDVRTNGAAMDSGPFTMSVLPMAFLKVAEQANPDKYTSLFKESYENLNYFISIDEFDGIRSLWPDFYPMNLNWESIWTWLIFEQNPGIRVKLLQFLEYTYDAIANEKNAYYQCLYLSLDPEDNPNSAASNSTLYNRIVAEIDDALARMSNQDWNGYNIYPVPDLSQIGLNFSNPTDRESLMDPNTWSTYEKLSQLANFTGGLWNVDNMMNHTSWALPVDWRPPSDFIWQRNAFELREYAYTNINNEQLHADLTVLYWFARYMNFVAPPTPSMNIHPVTVNSTSIYDAFNGAGMPSSYTQYYSIVEALVHG